jgi:hemolysin III
MVKVRELTHSEEITNAILHAIGVGLAIAALVILLVYANQFGDTWYTVSFSIYGASLIFLYTASTLYHSFPPGRVKSIFKIIDHSCIYLLIAGTYTPLTLTALRGPLGWTIFGVVWSIALIGIVFKAYFINRFLVLSTLLYLFMGWLILLAIKPLITGLSTTSLIFLLTGGALYTLGTIFYGLQKIKYNHAIWHVFVLAGSICHFFTVLYLLPK